MDRGSSTFSAHLIDTFYHHPNNFISTLLVGNNIALVIYGILMAQLIERLILTPLGIHVPDMYGDCPNDTFCLIIQTLVSTTIVLFTGEFLPKALFRIDPNRMMRAFALPTYIIYIFLWPISKFTSGLSKLILRLVGVKVKSGEEDKAFTKVDLDYLIQSNIERVDDEDKMEDEVKIFQNALDFSNVKVRDWSVSDYSHDYRFVFSNDFYGMDASEVTGKYLLRFLNSIYYDVRSGKYFSCGQRWENGKYHYSAKHSKILWEEFNCPLTGICYDNDILKPIWDWHKKPNWNLSLRDLVDECLESFFSSWEEENLYCGSDEYCIQELTESSVYEDVLYFEDGRKFDGIYEDAA